MSSETGERVAITFDDKLGCRSMQTTDLPAVHAMEVENNPFPWTPGIFRDCLRHNYQCLCLLRECDFIGYAILQIVKDESHLLNICVDHSLQGQGYGQRFLEYLMRESVERGARTLFLEARSSNTKAMGLYAKVGFHEIGRRRHYYQNDGQREDAIVMACELIGVN
ncbi:MAG: ribosomal-protein-alanine N-acetyltransferase [Gammaproteobacteria bacterium]|nr:MAG: ribosomal-protein-alanine N-acetyltransferase [Gammaproteobacteria bacterium]PIE37382.1 MAG: ribosomal-protein-alanine N-acetyltransferase [Gammaproteobacteria bacterium]